MAINRTEKINLYREITNIMHQPSVNGHPFYIRLADGTDKEGDYDEAMKDAEFVKNISSNINSPTNIRRVFITNEGITIHYYASPIYKGGKSPRGHITSHKFKRNFKDIAEDILMYDQKLQNYAMAIQSGDVKAKPPIKYTVENSGMQCFSNPYTLNNIEEIYFDWVMLLAVENQPYIGGEAFCRNLVYNILSGQTGCGFQENPGLMNLFIERNSGGASNIRKRFPRLRMIGFVSNLADIMNNPRMDRVNTEFDDPKSAGVIWIMSDRNKQLIKEMNSLVMTVPLQAMTSDLKKLNQNFTVKVNDYVFDRDYLQKEIDGFKAAVEQYNLKLQQAGANGEAAEASDEAMALVTRIKKLVKDNSQKGKAESIVRSAIAGKFSASELNEVLNSIESASDRRMVASMFGMN